MTRYIYRSDGELPMDVWGDAAALDVAGRLLPDQPTAALHEALTSESGFLTGTHDHGRWVLVRV